jgi:hypothetical protein
VYPGGRTGEEDDLLLSDLTSYEGTVGKTAAWVYFSDNWYRNHRFPLAAATWIRAHGAVPYIRLMLRDHPGAMPDPEYSLRRILAGDFDADLEAWARAARDFGTPLIVEYGTEVNGRWFPWNGRWNGAGTLAGYGSPSQADGPERFRHAYRRIVRLMRDQGAANITWVFHVNGDDQPGVWWNRFERYYPGDAFVDWVGVSAYGALSPLDDWCDSFRATMDGAYPRLRAMAPAKPVFVLEFGVAKGNPLCGQATWAKAALASLTGGRWRAVVGFSWWNEHWPNDDDPDHDTTMRVQDNGVLAGLFRAYVGENDDVLGSLVLAGP